MGTLGHKIFVKILTSPTNVQTYEHDSVPEVIFELKQGKADSMGQCTNEGFVILKGSRIRQQVAPSCPKRAVKAREKYAAVIGVDGVLTVDILLRSPVEAACYVTGASINAREAWKTAEGKTLKEIECA